MISVCQIFTDFKGAMNTWTKGHFRPQSFEWALHEAQLEIFNLLRKEWEKSQIISDNLRPFFKSVQIPIKDYPKGGMIMYPKDYSSFSTMRFLSKTKKGAAVLCSGIDILDVKEKEGTCKRPLREEEKVEAYEMEELIERPIAKIHNANWGAAVEHEFVPLDLDNPGCTQYNDGFKVLPKKIGYVVLDYLAIPARPKFNYSRGPRDSFICGNCEDLIWGEEILPEIMSRLKTKYASYVSNQQKYSEGQKETSIVTS